MSGGGAGPLVPTFTGFVQNSMDGLLLFEACLSGKLHHVPRRPHDRERSSLIKSGSVFIYEENASGIKRWTDGVAWSPSRILGNFLIYRELEKPFPPGEKKRAMKRKRTSLPGEPYPRRDSDENEGPEQITPISPPTPIAASEEKPDVPSSDADKELERQLIGSLVDSYGFRPDGLVKKTMSVSINGISHHMVSYYKVDDVKNGVLPRPPTDARLQGIQVRPELYLKQNFRAPVEETEQYAIDGHMHGHHQMMYSPMGPYGGRPAQYFGGQPYGMYVVPTTAPGPYGPVSGASWGGQQQSAGAVPYGSHPGYGPPSQGPYYNKDSAGPSPGGVGKTEEGTPNQQQLQYGSQYPPSYPGMHRGSAQSTPNMVQSAYQTPVQPTSSTFGPMSNRPSVGGGTITSPTTNGQPQQGYGPPPGQQQYGVRSPTQGYGMQSAPNSAVPQSPHSTVKSPNSGAPPSGPPDGQMGYRSGSYAVAGAPQSAQAGGDISGLGISNNYPSQPPQSQNYSSYVRSGEVAPNGGQYGQ